MKPYESIRQGLSEALDYSKGHVQGATVHEIDLSGVNSKTSTSQVTKASDSPSPQPVQKA